MERRRLIEYLVVWEAEELEKRRKHTRYVRRAADGRLLVTAVVHYATIPAAMVADICEDLEIPPPPDINDEPKISRAARRDNRRKSRD